jgi:endoglucanase
MKINAKLPKSCLLILSLLLPVLVFSQREKAFEINRKLGRGINYGNMFEAPSETAWGNQWKPEYPRIIAQLGFNHVRIPVRWEPTDRSLVSAPYTISLTFLNRIKQVVDSTLAQGLFAIINMHHHDTLFKYPEAQKARFLAQWEQISNYFKDYPDSLLFEILNEPNGNLTAELWNTYLSEALGKIRVKNPTREVLVGVAEYGGLSGLSKLQLPDDPNIILTVHYYNPFKFTHQGATWVSGSDPWLGTKWLDSEEERNVVRQEFEPLRLLSKQKNVPVHIGEFGAYSKADLESRGKWTTFVSRYFEEQNWSWAYWEFSASFGIFDPVLKTLNPTLTNALLVNKIPEPAQFIVTQFYKSDFRSGTDGWVMYRQGTAVSQMLAKNGALSVQISDGGAETWHVQIVKNSVQLYKDKKYRVSFKVKAAAPRTIICYTGMSVSPWSSYSEYGTFSITDSLKEYSFIFDMKTTDLSSRIVFDLGKSVTGIEVSEVRLEELTLKTTSTPIVKSNLQVWPNPVKSSFMISGVDNIDFLSVYNISGQTILEKTGPVTGQIDISDLFPGIYILAIDDGKTKYSVKIMKE